MCGIFGVIGKGNLSAEVKPALERLSYRGYDSAGMVFIDGDEYKETRCLGHPENLYQIPDLSSSVAIGHNRWATHGSPSVLNAHPHVSNDRKIALVHNGIIENYAELKVFLEERGFDFYSETDTEIIPNLLQHFYEESGDIEKAIIETSVKITGAYAIVFTHLDFKDKMFILKLGSPVCIGKDGNGAVFVCSDMASLPISTKKAVPIEDDKYIIIDNKENIVMKSLNGKKLRLTLSEVEINPELHVLGEYGSFFEKEIHGQVHSVRNAIVGRVSLENVDIKLSGISDNIDELLSCREIIFTGSGSALNAAKVGAFAMENMARIRTRVVPAGELKYYNPVIDKDTVLIAVSQSGETADTLGCVKMAKKHGATCIGIVNVPNSAIAREVDSGVYIRAGSEISVASTKAVTNQIIAMILMASLLASRKDLSSLSFEKFVKEIYELPSVIERVLSKKEDIRNIANKYYNYKNMVCIGRSALEPIAKEIALKIKEISYIHAEGYSAAELKHGPLALICEDFPTLALVGNGVIAEKMLSNIREVKSRGGKIIAIIEESEVDDKITLEVDDFIVIPDVNYKVISTIPYMIVGQLLTLFLAELNNRAIDRPRNLAKAVSVE